MRRDVKVAGAVLAIKAAQLCALFVSPEIWDTSTILLFDVVAPVHDGEPSLVKRAARRLAERLLIWDNVFFASLALNDTPRFEHEYAFSRVWARTVLWISQIGEHADAAPDLWKYALVAAILSFMAHLGSCLLLALLTAKLRQLKTLRNGPSPSTSALIYALHPAGTFLLSGYAESAFAFLSFAALLLYTSQRFVLAGTLFALSVLLRSNGLLWGSLFAVTLLGELCRRRWHVWRILSLIIGGSLIAAAFVGPQFYAYRELCLNRLDAPVWCAYKLPSIYTHVQTHYWSNGFLKYWTVPNIPNFLLAAPMLLLLAASTRFLYRCHLLGLASVQALVALGALLFWNVQIVTRLASCLPGPVWYLSALLASSDSLERRKGKAWIAFFVVWLGVQATLYGAFLPPA